MLVLNLICVYVAKHNVEILNEMVVYVLVIFQKYAQGCVFIVQTVKTHLKQLKETPQTSFFIEIPFNINKCFLQATGLEFGSESRVKIRICLVNLH